MSLKILTCFKLAPDFERLADHELLAICNGQIALATLRHSIGVYDEAALELGLRLRDEAMKQQIEISLKAITVGRCDDSFANSLYAIGYDQVIVLQSPDDYIWQPEFPAALIAQAIQDSGGFDIILTSRQASPGESGRFPAELVQRLSAPLLDSVYTAEWLTDRRLAVQTRTGQGFCSLICHYPVILAVCETEHPYLRVATIREKLAAASQKPTRINLSAHEQPDCGEDPQLLNLSIDLPDRHCKFVKADTAQAQADLIWQQWLGTQV